MLLSQSASLESEVHNKEVLGILCGLEMSLCSRLEPLHGGTSGTSTGTMGTLLPASSVQTRPYQALRACGRQHFLLTFLASKTHLMSDPLAPSLGLRSQQGVM